MQLLPRIGTPNWAPELGPRIGTPIWDPDLGPRFVKKGCIERQGTAGPLYCITYTLGNY
jgi:hypothetical protein